MTPSNPSQNDTGMAADNRWFQGWALPLIYAWAMSAKVFIRTGMGSEMPGFAGALAIPLLLTFGAINFSFNQKPLLWFTGAFLVACLVQRITMVVRRWRGHRDTPSFYDGYPLVCRLVPRLDEAFAKRFVEPILVTAIGWTVQAHSNQPLGNYLFFAGLSLFLTSNLSALRERQQLRVMRDALMEQRERARRLRQLLEQSGLN